MIYAIRAGEFVKFGYTRKYGLKRRVAAMQTGCPYELVVLVCCDGDRVYENYIHLKLKKANCHFRGEWFRWSEEVEQVIKQMLAKGDSKPAELPKLHGTSHRLSRVLEYGKSLLVEDANRLVPGRI